MEIILLNGPPRAGKDFAAELLLRSPLPFVHLKFAAPLRTAVPAMFGLSEQRWTELFNTAKEVRTPELLGHSPRSAMIWLSEDVMKPTYGTNVFGHLAVNRIREYGGSTLVLSDCGFTHEVDPLIDAFGADSILIVQLTREGCTFEGDSRGWVDHPLLKTVRVSNNGSADDLQHNLLSLITNWLNARRSQCNK